MLAAMWRRLVRTGFRLLYNEMAWSYDGVSWLVSLGEWRKWQQAALPFVQGERVLELAHGPGHLLATLSRAGCEVVGLDFSRQMGRMAARRLRRGGQAVRLARGRAQGLPFAAQSFDTVLSTFPTPFIAERRTAREVQRVLRGGGRYIIVPEGALRGKGPLQRFIAWLFKITGQGDGSLADDGAGPADEARWQPFRQMLEEAGFAVEMRRLTLARSVVTVVVGERREAAPGAPRDAD